MFDIPCPLSRSPHHDVQPASPSYAHSAIDGISCGAQDLPEPKGSAPWRVSSGAARSGTKWHSLQKALRPPPSPPGATPDPVPQFLNTL
jgi:hypothetical protein